MLISARNERLCKWIFLISLLLLVITYFYKDKLPEPGFYDVNTLPSPVQTPTDRGAFTLVAKNQVYTINPKYDYELHGVVVTYSNAGGFGNIWHHYSWQDFINLRDLCVIWGDNVKSGIYEKLTFSSDSWTCWVQWPNRETGLAFKGNALSNNHLLTNDPTIKRILMQAEIGDQIHIKGMLAEYANPSNGFKRGTSTTRDDSGNGACETIFLNQFEIVKKAHPQLRLLYTALLWVMAFSLAGWVYLFIKVPAEKY